jgi:hypothetical protein
MKEEIKKPDNPLVYPSNIGAIDHGITLRDMFANSVLQGKMSTEHIAYFSDKEIVERCYQLADAMLEAREQFKNK